jgi:hypothetical protein
MALRVRSRIIVNGDDDRSALLEEDVLVVENDVAWSNDMVGTIVGILKQNGEEPDGKDGLYFLRDLLSAHHECNKYANTTHNKALELGDDE